MQDTRLEDAYRAYERAAAGGDRLVLLRVRADLVDALLSTGWDAPAVVRHQLAVDAHELAAASSEERDGTGEDRVRRERQQVHGADHATSSSG